MLISFIATKKASSFAAMITTKVSLLSYVPDFKNRIDDTVNIQWMPTTPFMESIISKLLTTVNHFLFHCFLKKYNY